MWILLAVVAFLGIDDLLNSAGLHWATWAVAVPAETIVISALVIRCRKRS